MSFFFKKNNIKILLRQTQLVPAISDQILWQFCKWPEQAASVCLAREGRDRMLVGRTYLRIVAPEVWSHHRWWCWLNDWVGHGCGQEYSDPQNNTNTVSEQMFVTLSSWYQTKFTYMLTCDAFQDISSPLRAPTGTYTKVWDLGRTPCGRNHLMKL
eukprot:SAG31_NODE_18500_length_633_cov_2.280899_1_plen_156_part_00